MAKYRNRLPQLAGDLYLTDGGIETTLVFLDGIDLPHFAAFPLLASASGARALRSYFRSYAELALRAGTGLLLETPTWRANADWGALLGYDAAALAQANGEAVRLLEGIRAEYENAATPIVISGCLGPRGDGYVVERAMSVADAEHYHHAQVQAFAASSADLVTAITMNYVEEALGIVQAARSAGMPVVVSFTVETDGRLPTGQPLGEAIAAVDAATAGYPAYYMLNCAHPSHFDSVLAGGGDWLQRIRGLRANASRLSHAELNEATALDIGVPHELGLDYAALKSGALPRLNVMGGCCGTDPRHVGQIADACLPLFRRPVAALAA